MHWHSVIDEELGPDSSFNFETAFDDPYGDFRMHFCTWELSDEALNRCFDVLPMGKQMADRAIDCRRKHRAESTTLTEENAVQLFQVGLDGYSRFSSDPELKNPILVKYTTSDKFMEEALCADSVSIVLERIEWQLPPEHDGVGSFLRETLYRLADSYDVVDYIEWPLFLESREIDLYQPFAKLALTGAHFPLLHENGPILFVVTDSKP